MVTFYKDARQLYRVAAWDRLEWLEHGFGTRASGRWATGTLVTMRQTHSAVCLPVDQVPEERPAGDALVSATPGLLLAVRTADCLPVLMVDPQRRVVAAVHAGWRGSAAAISAKVVEVLSRHFGSQPGDLEVAIGPGICGRCYEVGPEVARRFNTWLPALAGASEPARLDLTEVNRRQLLAAGVEAHRLHLGAPCTACSAEEFHSHRRQGPKAGRMVSGIGIRRR